MHVSEPSQADPDKAIDALTMNCTSGHESAAKSVSNSQTSSSDQSAASQASQHNFASQNTSRSSINYAAQSQDKHLPVESFSASLTSPRTVTKTVSHNTALKLWNDVGRSQSRLPALNTGGAVTEPHHTATTHGHKRTANGLVKPATSSQTTSPVETSQLGHTRHTSTTSSSTQISEVSYLQISNPFASDPM